MDNHWHKQNKINSKMLSLSSLTSGIAVFAVMFCLTKVFSVSPCPFNNILKIRCFGCGLTRAFIEILNLNFKSAFYYNVLSIPLFICIVLYYLLSLFDIIFDKNYIIYIENILSKSYMYPIYAAVIIISTVLNNRHSYF